MSEAKGTKVAILAEDLYEDIELWYPYYRFIEAGAEVDIIGSGRLDTFKGKHGLPVKPDIDIDQANVDDYDAVVVPGGFSPDYMRRNPKMIEFVRQAGESGKVIGAICHGPWALASAGLLKDRQATSYFSIRDDIEGAGANFVDDAAVVDGNIVTSRVPDDLPAFMRAMLERLQAQS